MLFCPEVWSIDSIRSNAIEQSNEVWLSIGSAHGQGSRKSQRSEIFGIRRSGARMRALPHRAMRESSRPRRRRDQEVVKRPAR